MSSAPWAQSVFIDWQPWLAYWERRIEFLRRLDDELDLDEFILEDDEAGGRWADETYELTLTENSLTLRGNGEGAQQAPLLKAGGLALELLKPFNIKEVQVVLGHIEPSSRLAEDLQTEATNSLFGDWFPDLMVEDYAVILDGKVKNSKHLAHLEIGILSKSEIPTRLAGFAGEEMPAGSKGSLRWWAGRDLPEAAFFIGSSWRYAIGEESGPTIEQIEVFWDNALSEAEKCFGSIPSVAKAHGNDEEQEG